MAAPSTSDLSTGEALEEKYALVEDILVQLQAAEDDPDALNALFDELMAEYTEDTGYDSCPEGYICQTGQVVQEFEDAMAELEEGEFSGIVETEYAAHHPAHAGGPGRHSHGLRSSPAVYIVADQLYSDMAEEWIDSTDVHWTEGFEDLGLAAVLGPLS